ncbi:MAG: hypothetical protein LBG92_01920 [Prevotellaceae bacterium]|jgi:hypothetical protein|nr:hypothetical protein [Prevotellaceae bacterium]
MKNNILNIVTLIIVSVTGIYAQTNSVNTVIGNINDTAKYANTTNVIQGVELIEYIPNLENYTGLIKTVIYRLQNHSKKPVKLIKPHLYEVDGEKPGKELLPDIPIHEFSEKGKKITVRIDISKNNISLPSKGIFVGLEFAGMINENENTNNDILTVWNNRKGNPHSLSYSRYKDKLEKTSNALYMSLEIITTK